jgi:hypothetical protein
MSEEVGYGKVTPAAPERLSKREISPPATVHKIRRAPARAKLPLQ